MSDQTCGCGCGTVDQSPTDSGRTGEYPAPDQGHWIEDGLVDAELPDGLQRALGQLLGAQSVESVSAYFEELSARLDREHPTVDDLCHADEQTPHWGERNDQRYYFQCFYDAVVLAAMTDSETTIRTASPDGTVIQGTATGSGEFSVRPDDAVMSFGVHTDRERPVESIEETYAAICPYVKAFPSLAAYHRWAATVPAVTIAVPMADGTELARLFTG